MILLALEMEEGACRIGKRWGADPPLELPEGTGPDSLQGSGLRSVRKETDVVSSC